jgi:nitrogen fixation/metabolism regulation signal transduction histidine kinase
VALLGSILVSFLILGAMLMTFLAQLNNEKNKENLLEQALSILVEMQHKFGSRSDLRELSTLELETTLIKFSNVFFSDINIYSPDGMLLGSSRPQIFETGLLSTRMNRKAYISMFEEQSSSFVQKESIGRHTYYSAYLPMLNNQNKLTAFINLPYFSRQEDLKQEISSFMVAFVNIYVIFLLMGVFIAFLISGYIASPLRMLTQKIRSMKLGSTNEKIEWKRQDEIGELVEEYNRKLDELAENVKRLAESERESAWREMARQVAHEIKNPLTPMKLSVQYLQKAWEEKTPDWDSRLKRFSEALVEQIEVLSSIATEFSDFAKMPSPVMEKVNLDELLKGALTFYQDIVHVQVTYSIPSGEWYINADRKQMFRVFTNLLNNAVQAIDREKGGTISVRVITSKTEYQISITDTGSGIPEEQAGRIFQPNFTTKSGGMGLGLAIVKEIVRSQGGTITFVSAKGEGTTFTVILPAFDGSH